MVHVRILWFVVGTLLVCGGTAPGQEPGYLMNLSSQFSSLYAGIFHATHYGGQPQQLALPASHRAEWRRRMTQMVGNRHVLVYEPDPLNSSIPLYVFDADTSAYVPFYTIPETFSLYSFLQDQEGDLVVCGVGLVGTGLFRVTGNGRLQRFSTLPSSEMDRVIIDVDTGDYIVSQSPNIWRIRPSGTRSLVASVYHGGGPFQDPATGELLFWGSGGFPAVLFKVTRAGSVTTTTFPGVDIAGVSAVDETPTGMGEYVVSIGAGIIRFPRQGGPITTLFVLPPAPIPSMPMGSIRDFMMNRVRNVSTANAGARNKWTLFVSFPYDAMSTYLCLVGASGVRPGITLPDGKIIRLNPDPVTSLGLAGLLPGFSGLTGTLDARGTAQGLIDLSALPPAAAGTPFWLVGLVLNSTPPVIQRVSPPMVIQIR